MLYRVVLATKGTSRATGGAVAMLRGFTKSNLILAFFHMGLFLFVLAGNTSPK